MAGRLGWWVAPNVSVRKVVVVGSTSFDLQQPPLTTLLTLYPSNTLATLAPATPGRTIGRKVHQIVKRATPSRVVRSRSIPTAT